VSLRQWGEPLCVCSGGGSGSPLQAVANIAALAALDDATLDDGVWIATLSVRDLWMLDKSATSPAADGITVIVPLSGSGRWTRAQQSHPSWRLQTAWHIDQGAGNDEDDGLTAGTALASHEEFQRRVADSDQPIAVAMLVTFDANYTGDIENKAHVSQVAPYGSIEYRGTRTVLFSGSFTAVTPWATPTVVGTMTDAALPVSWAASGGLEQLCVLTSGPNAGAASWAMVEPVAKTARYNGFFNDNTFATHDPGVAETYDVVSLTQLTGLITQDVPGWFQFKDLHINPPLGFDRGVQTTDGFMSFTYCHLEMRSPFFGGSTFYGGTLSCCNMQGLSVGLRAFNTTLFLYSNWMRTGVVAGNGSQVQIQSRNVGQSVAGSTAELTAEQDGSVRVLAAGEWVVVDQVTAASRAVRIETHGNAHVQGVVWGLTNTMDYAAEVDSGATLIYATPAASRFAVATATIADVLVGATPSAVAGLPVADLSKGAFAVEE